MDKKRQRFLSDEKIIIPLLNKLEDVAEVNGKFNF